PFMEDLGRKIDSATIEDLGQVRRVISDKENTTLVDGKGDPSAVKGRIEQIRRAIDDTNSEYDKEKLQERLAKLAGGVAVINIGGHSEVEVKERKDRV